MSDANRCLPACPAQCDLDELFGVDGFTVMGVSRDEDRGCWLVGVETTGGELAACPACGVIATAHERRDRRLHDLPVFDTAVVVVWRKRRWRCREQACLASTWSEDAGGLCAERSKLTYRAVGWVIDRMRRDHLTVSSAARLLGVDWHTVWSGVKPVLEARAADETRFKGVRRLGVDEHTWHHTPRKTASKGPMMMTGMVDFTPTGHGTGRARLLDLVPGRSGRAYSDWLQARGVGFTERVQIAALDPFRGYANAIGDQMDDAVAVLDAFHVVKLGTDMVDDVRRRVQQSTLGHRGRKHDPLYGIARVLRSGAERLTPRQWRRLEEGLKDGDPGYEVTVAWHCYQQLRSAFHLSDLAEGRLVAERILGTFHTCPVREVARLGKTLRRWRDAFLAYFTTGRASNAATEAVNNLIELHRRLARGYRNPGNYRLRMLLAAGGLDASDQSPAPRPRRGARQFGPCH